MAISNRDRAGKAFEQLAAGIAPYVDRRMSRFHIEKDNWFGYWLNSLPQGVPPDAHLADPQVLLRVTADFWDVAFKQDLSRAIRNVVFSLRNRRNDWAHNKPFQFDDTYRTLDEIHQLLVAVEAPNADEVGADRDALLRARFEAEAKKAASDSPAPSGVVKGLRPWREVAEPHDDVAQGRFDLAEFAADLQAVRSGRGAAEYVDPVEFFRRTYVTEGLGNLLVDAAQRVTLDGGTPVVDLQTTFGGGKTHSMIALYHLLSGVHLESLPEELQKRFSDAGITQVPSLPRAVLVGTALKPGQPEVKEDGTEVRTLWGELAWQLGGRKAFDLVAQADATASSPGDALDDVFTQVGPCLILIDEWVAYARTLYGENNLPGGSFDTHFTFAQALTEAAKRCKGVLLVVSIPASEPTDGGGEASGSEIELGGFGGREALGRLKAVIGRLESSWRPASAEESFEIVRRRLFKPIPADRLADRDATTQAFADYYRKQKAELPEEVQSPRYQEQMLRAYPIHPELFARLYQDWSTLERFQRTRGVLRLMASVISALWDSGDQSPLIMPASLPLELSKVNLELLRHLEDSFKPVLDTDIDGEDSTSRAIDREFPNLGRYQATRRVARAVFFGSAPTLKSANRGIETQRVRLACAMPGETIETYGDALKRLSDRASFLYVEGSRCWFDTRQSVVRQAQEAAEQLRTQRIDEVHAELIRRIESDVRSRGAFGGVHVAPRSSEEVGDDDVLRLVVLAPELHFSASSEHSLARTAAEELLNRRGNGARQRRNMLVFLAPDSQAMELLEVAAAEYLAWSRIVEDAELLNLDKAQERQAKERCENASRAIEVRMGEAYRWLLVPKQSIEAGAQVELVEYKLDGSSGLATRAADRLVREGVLCTQYAPVLLRTQLDGILASEWADGSVAVGRLWEVFTRYPYLPKLRDRQVMEETVANGPASMVWQAEGFAVADVVTDGHYGGLVIGGIARGITPTSVLVKPEVALAQTAPVEPGGGGKQVDGGAGGTVGGGPEPEPTGEPSAPKVFQGAIHIDPIRAVKSFGQLADEVLVHLQAEGEVEIVVELRAKASNGFTDGVVRTVTENAKVLKFETGAGFETD